MEDEADIIPALCRGRAKASARCHADYSFASDSAEAFIRHVFKESFLSKGGWRSAPPSRLCPRVAGDLPHPMFFTVRSSKEEVVQSSKMKKLESECSCPKEIEDKYDNVTSRKGRV